MAVRVDRAARDEVDTIAYLGENVLRNALDIWNLEHEGGRYELNLSRVDDKIRAHLSIYRTPEANYVNLGGSEEPAEALLHLLPAKAVLTISPDFKGMIAKEVRYDAIYPNDIMVVGRGEEKLRSPGLAMRLAREHEVEYSTFGSSFNAPRVPLDWTRERLDNDIVFGAFSEGRLASVASVVAWLPQMALIMGVETKKEFRGRGLGGAVVSAAVQEALRRSKLCSLFVRSDNNVALGLYRALGFWKVGEELWVDIGTGMVP